MTLRVVELFAGVGGFRLGLEGPPGAPRDGNFAVVWSNQWEPSTKKQHAAEVYVERWGLKATDENPLVFESEGERFINDDIGEIHASDVPDHDLLVGGFPCQDYSVAKTAKDATGIEGKKGVLWWEIHRLLKEKKPTYAMLENVDRLLKSPTKQRGRDFAVMLASLGDLGYIVEWRVINAADYGMPQRRRRVFILAYAPGTPQHEALKGESSIKSWIESDGPFARAFPIHPLPVLMAIPHQIKGNNDWDLADVSERFNKGAPSTSKSPFKKSGIMVGNNYYTYDTVPNYQGTTTNLSDVLLQPKEVPDEYLIDADSVMKAKGWKYLKGAKDEPREGTDGFTYSYKEGPMVFPDALDKPSRTIITGEGGSTPSRFKHVVKFRPTKGMRERLELDGSKAQAIRVEVGLAKNEWLRRLTPIELERLNMFPDNHTAGPTDGKRAFFMGNALVVGIIHRLGKALLLTENVGSRWKTEEDLLKYAQRLEGKKFSEISESIGKLDENHRKHTKGVAAKVIETDYFEIPSNSSEHPDFESLGIELKVSPLRYLPKLDLYTTKERNVIKMVDYNDLADCNHWKSNKVAKKLKRILFILYVHENGVNAWDWKVVKTFLWSPNEAESQAIQTDYDIMRTKVLAGEHLSEGDHTFFATCPKHRGGYLKATPMDSPRASLAVHPVLEFAEKRGFCIKREAFIELIANTIGTPLQKHGRSIGIDSSNLEV